MPGQRPQRDHYAVLGVPRSASAEEITSAYRRLVRSLHPDTRPEDSASAEDLADVLAAYDTLRDPGRRAAYDIGRGGPASSAAAGRPVPVRVRTRTSRAAQAPPPRRRSNASSLLRGPEEVISLAPSRIGPRFAVLPPGWDDGDSVTRIVLQWLRQADSWLR
ncbi:J domain-containing protein [Streptomyces vastus]|uniref:J domain-containing protein n=1 Tax=Streptomyces vastus TaxID=285451 RepID=A0ABN3RRA8_9ACTN